MLRLDIEQRTTSSCIIVQSFSEAEEEVKFSRGGGAAQKDVQRSLCMGGLPGLAKWWCNSVRQHLKHIKGSDNR